MFVKDVTCKVLLFLAEGKSFESFKPGMNLEDVMDTYLPFEDDRLIYNGITCG